MSKLKFKKTKDDNNNTIYKIGSFCITEEELLALKKHKEFSVLDKNTDNLYALCKMITDSLCNQREYLQTLPLEIKNKILDIDNLFKKDKESDLGFSFTLFFVAFIFAIAMPELKIIMSLISAGFLWFLLYQFKRRRLVKQIKLLIENIKEEKVND